MKYNTKPIICPKCNRKSGTHDGRSTIPKSVKCKNCNKLVVYNPETRKTENKPIPPRTQGSGMRFY